MIKIDGEPVETVKFSDGTVVPKIPANFNIDVEKTVHIPAGVPFKGLTVTWLYESLDEFFTLAQIVNYYGGNNIVLNMPFFPFSRQDRRIGTADGRIMPDALKTFCMLIDSLGLLGILSEDPHSVAVESSLRTEIYTRTALYKCKKEDNIVFVAPDAGAAKRAQANATFYEKPLIQCLKSRDTASEGAVTKLDLFMPSNLPEDLTGVRFVVIDDICDGGATFLVLAAKINQEMLSRGYERSKYSLELYTTFGIYSKGLEILRKEFDRVVCRMLVPARDKEQEVIDV